MKKRKELDALIGNRSKREPVVIDNGHMEYDSLNSSLSSPTADTYVPPNGNFFTSSKRIKRHSGRGCGCTLRRMIRICLPACFLSLVAACITACIGIVWMQVQLKTDVEKLRDRIAKLEAWQNDQPSALDDMKKTMSVIEKEVLDVKEGEGGVRELAEKLALLTQKFEGKVAIPNQKLQEIQSQSEEIQKTIEELKTSIKALKSTTDEIKASQNILTSAHDQLKGSVEKLKTELSDANVNQLTQLVSSSKQNVENGITKMNNTLHLMTNNLTSLQHKVGDIEKRLYPEQLWKSLGPRANLLEGDIESLKQEKVLNGQTVAGISKELSEVKSQIAEMLAGVKNGNSTQSNTRDAIQTIHGIGDYGSQNSPTEERSHALGGMLAEIEAKLDDLDTNGDGALTQGELTAAYGEEISTELLKYDLNHDDVLSKNELWVVPTSTPVTQAAKTNRKRGSDR